MSPETRERFFRWLREGRLCVLSTGTPRGEPHSSVMHYSCAAEPPNLVFSADDRSAKAKDCRENPRASVAMGWSEADWVTAQMRGALRALISPDEIEAAKAAHYAVHPNARHFENDPHTLFLGFEPDWARFSDLAATPAIVEEMTLPPVGRGGRGGAR
jgi:general stress protein 26